MSKPLLRGKKTSLKNFTENFTKVPNIILHAEGLTAVEKLILIELQSYSTRPNYVLAYTRMAEDLKINKTNLIERWKSLIERNIIQVTTDDRYTINYELLSHVGNTNIGKTDIGNTDTSLKSHVGKTDMPISEKPILNVGKTDIQGMVGIPIEEETKEEKESKNKENTAPALKPSPAVAATVSPGADEEKIKQLVDSMSLDMLKGFENISFDKFIEMTGGVNDYSLQLKMYSSIKKKIEEVFQEEKTKKNNFNPELLKEENIKSEIFNPEIIEEKVISSISPYDDEFWIKDEKKDEIFNPYNDLPFDFK